MEGDKDSEERRPHSMIVIIPLTLLALYGMFKPGVTALFLVALRLFQSSRGHLPGEGVLTDGIEMSPNEKGKWPARILAGMAEIDPRMKKYLGYSFDLTESEGQSLVNLLQAFVNTWELTREPKKVEEAVTPVVDYLEAHMCRAYKLKGDRLGNLGKWLGIGA
jgi:hypothetical protein